MNRQVASATTTESGAVSFGVARAAVKGRTSTPVPRPAAPSWGPSRPARMPPKFWVATQWTQTPQWPVPEHRVSVGGEVWRQLPPRRQRRMKTPVAFRHGEGATPRDDRWRRAIPAARCSFAPPDRAAPAASDPNRAPPAAPKGPRRDPENLGRLRSNASSRHERPVRTLAGPQQYREQNVEERATRASAKWRGATGEDCTEALAEPPDAERPGDRECQSGPARTFRHDSEGNRELNKSAKRIGQHRVVIEDRSVHVMEWAIQPGLAPADEFNMRSVHPGPERTWRAGSAARRQQP